MEIQKRLILNRTPKDMPYASIPCAKNMMIDDTGSFLTNDIGFTEAFEGDSDEEIVGVLPCNNEIIIFTYTPARYNGETLIREEQHYVYRKPDSVHINSQNAVHYLINTNWKWNGGKLCGSYTYNYKGELIIALGEYDVPNNIKVPMKSWNLDTGSLVQTYNIEEDIPYYDSSYDVQTNGNLVCGVYTFFIRFKIDDFNYTKWFQITGDINIIQEAKSKKYDHQFLNASDNLLIPVPKPINNVDAPNDFTINANNISNKSIVLNIIFSNYTDTRFQLGYIIKRNSDISGRIQGEYDIASLVDNKISIVNNLFIEEVSVDSLLEVPNQFFNVKNIINYNNRLYIANYEEYPIEDLTDFASSRANTEISIDTEEEEEVESSRSTRDVETTTTLNVIFDLYQSRSRWPYDHKDNTLSELEFTIDSSGYITSTDIQSLLDEVTSKLALLAGQYIIQIPWDNTTTELYWFIQKANDYSYNGAICIAKNGIATGSPTGWDWNFNINNFAIKITGTNKNNLDIIVEYGGSSWSLLGKNGEHSCLLGYQNSDNMFFGNSIPETYFNPLIKVGNQMPNDINLSVNRIVDEHGDEEPSESGGSVAEPGVNTRTLHPYQKYNFFIHYIRKDGSYTLGFPVDAGEDFYTLSGNNTVLIPKVRASNPDASKYVGYFITYEDVEQVTDCVYFIIPGTTTDSDKIVLFTNANYLYDIDSIRGGKLIIDNVYYTIRDGSIKYKENRLTYNHIEGLLEGSSGMTDRENIAYWIKDVKNIYNNITKVLYRLTKNIYTFGSYIVDKDYLPAFYSNQVIIFYTSGSGRYDAKELIIDPASSYAAMPKTEPDTTFEYTSITDYDARIVVEPMYSKYPTEAMNIKEDFEQAAITLHYKPSGSSDYTDKFRVNTLVSPDKLHDLLELKEGYKAKPSKSYTNFNNNNIYVFDKTIRRSDVISDESLVNGFRHFEINNYKNILENKGKIVNIVGIGLYFIVHTEQSIFVFDRTPKLTAKSQLDIPDTFAIDYQDVMPSNEGFGGLREKEESIITKNGYIWFDATNKIIFRYENGKASIISTDINNFIKYLDIDSVRFAEDIIYNRLIICIVTNKYVSGEKQFITLSYNFNTNTFVSLHDYKFTNNYRTTNKSYIFDNSTKYKLFEFDNTRKVKYLNLTKYQSYYFPYYQPRLTDDAAVTAKSYVDVIFNKNYFSIKQVDSIRYILSRIVGNNYPYKITEEQLERHFSGNEFKIYTDETDSGDLDIAVNENNINVLNDYKHPYYDKGCWNLSYFRNLIAIPVTETELRADAQKLGIDGDKYIEANSEDGTHLMSSDSRSLIYGKYIVVRFIFNNNVNVKLEGVDINVNPY